MKKLRAKKLAIVGLVLWGVGYLYAIISIGVSGSPRSAIIISSVITMAGQVLLALAFVMACIGWLVGLVRKNKKVN